MKNMNYRVTENNGGGITLYCVDAQGNEFAHNGYEYAPGQLFQDLANLLTDRDVAMWEGNDLKNDEICSFWRTRTKITEYGSDEVLENDEMYDADGNLIPLDINEYFDDDESTRLILSGDDENMTINRKYAGHNFSNELKHIDLLFETEDYCPKIIIE